MQTVRQRNRHILGLDGLRGLAVLAVVLYHLAPNILPGGYIGVDIFFVISGFLITILLLDEQVRRGTIAFKKFWLRRARRLLPALFVVIGVTSSIALLIKGDVLVGIGRQIIGALTFNTNWIEVASGSNYFDTAALHLFTNFWSLAVEEQFYLFWPFICFGLTTMFVLRRRGTIGALTCLGLAGISAFLMVYDFNGLNSTRVYYGTDTHLFGLMLGAALAFGIHNGAISSLSLHPLKVMNRRLKPAYIAFLSFGGLIFLLITLSTQSPFTYRGGLLLASLLTAITIVSTVSAPGVIRSILLWKPLEWLGIRSYGTYLWHWPLIVLAHYLLPVNTPHAFLIAAVCITALIAAIISFNYIENPVRLNGFRHILKRSIRREELFIDTTVSKWRLRPHPLLFIGLAMLACTFSAVVIAPSKTKAQIAIEAGQHAIKHTTRTTVPTSSTEITGSDITVVGDSVTLAAAPVLEVHLPGILINAEVSRSLRGDGFTTIDTLEASGILRKIVVIALGTNGYYGNGDLEKLVQKLGKRKVIFVNTYADREWATPNNQYVQQIASTHSNVYVADWSDAIAPHADYLVDGIHPDIDGAAIYTGCILNALHSIKQ